MTSQLNASQSELKEEFSQPIDAFMAYLRHEKQYSEHTLGQYKRQLIQAALVFQQDCHDWLGVSPDHIRRFSMQLRSKQYNPRSINLKLSCIRSLYKFLKAKHQHHQTLINPGEGIKGPKFQKPLPKNLDVDQMAQLLELPEDDALAVRDKAMMELMYSSGLRVSELVNANLNDIREGEIRVLGKGSKERVVPVGNKALAALEAWLKLRPQFAIEGDPALFVSKQKRRISTRHVHERMKDWGLKQGISTPVHPHKLRHSFASHMLESSGDLRAVQEMLGHSSLSATQVYTHVDFQHLAKVYDKAHPRAKKSK
ncbi:Tyrosine recombinase XerC [Pseudoalteromonas phenolica]|uniref:Tyrosine recombinase XerC n=2 Tax=Pseudoalteromonas phenolica TaxID=161398 RepID=A0A0S2JXK8_9GAMM|nr:Tyrosine recombinase XerC [Pseudoalteromonas phenolica]MBE0354911.1 integrase/recombinase XerC [Pseudoalteromonas phenolica O-BC30]